MSFHQQLANPPGTADHDPNHQGFRNPMAADDTAKQCRERILRSLDDEARYPANFIRFCSFIRMHLIFVAEQQHILVCRFAHIKHMHKLRYYRLLARDVAFAATHCCSNDKLERVRSNLGGGVVQFV